VNSNVWSYLTYIIVFVLFVFWFLVKFPGSFVWYLLCLYKPSKLLSAFVCVVVCVCVCVCVCLSVYVTMND
jgi:hypothetical protein